ncbi:MAG: hypothetical protein AAFO95_10115 [Cyanobacteria bacterium J06600_6]
MDNWYKRITLLLMTVSSLWIEHRVANANNLGTAVVECRDLNSNYEEIYSFETENYHINICQLEENFYYHRRSKSKSSVSNILVPAQAILQGSVFQATMGKVVYFVGMDNDRHYSSVMLNNNEIVFEPEVDPSSSNVAQNLTELNDRNLRNASLDLDSPMEETEQILACARDKSALHPRLEGWQELIGKPVSSANSYALKNGYSFDYNRQKNPTLALITTKTGGKIDLSVIPGSEIVEQVCVQPFQAGKN